MTEEIPKGTPGQDPVDPTRPVTPSPNSPGERDFASHMQTPANAPPPENSLNPTDDNKKPTPMQLSKAGQLAAGGQPTLQSVVQQMNAASGVLGDVKNKLHTKGLKLKKSQKQMVQQKLSDANENIRAASKQAGAEVGEPPDIHQKKNPIVKFLELVADGQTQLDNATHMLHDLGKSKELKPADFLIIQAKLQKAQQEIEFTSVVLGKAVDMLKNIFSVQI